MLPPLFAIHLSDGVLDTPWLVGGFLVAAVLLLAACIRLREEWIPRIGVFTAAFFAASSIPMPLFLLPVSVHPLLNGLLGVILGRRATLAVAVGLALQYLLVHHGGLTTLGLNTCIIAIPAILAGRLYPVFRKVRIPAFASGVLVGFAATTGTVLLNFFVLLAGGKDDFQTLAKLVLIAHMPVIVLESLLLGVLASYLEKVKPEMLGMAKQPERSS
jgi:cobalt/nickel transport system permease protein